LLRWQRRSVMGVFEGAVACYAAGELEGDRLAEQFGVYIASAFDTRMATARHVCSGTTCEFGR
jgi:hypothetical protein